MGEFKIGYERSYENVKKLFFFQINREIFSRKIVEEGMCGGGERIEQ